MIERQENGRQTLLAEVSSETFRFSFFQDELREFYT